VTTTQLAAIILVLLAAATESLSNVLQHKAANSAGRGGRAGKRQERTGEVAAVLRTLKKPLFLLGFFFMILGYAFHVTSLGLGNLVVIQVIFVSQLVFILPFARWISKTHITARDWLGAIIVTAGIAVFVGFAQPTQGNVNATTLQWLLAVAIVVALCAVVIVAGYRLHGAARAALLGCSGGLMNGLVAPLTKGTLAVLAHGIGAMFASWLFWATVIAALLGVLFPLMAFRAGPITASFPAVMSLNPIGATLLGVWLFGETLQGGLVNISAMTVAAVAIFIGIVWLSRSTAIAQAFAEPASTPGPTGTPQL